MDECTGIKFSSHRETKNGIVEPTCRKLKKMEDLAGKPVKILRQDNAGENKKLQERIESADWSGKLKIAIEYTAKGTPQQNHLAELGFTVVAARARAAMNHASVPAEMRYLLFQEFSNTITKLDWLSRQVFNFLQLATSWFDDPILGFVMRQELYSSAFIHDYLPVGPSDTNTALLWCFYSCQALEDSTIRLCSLLDLSFIWENLLFCF